MGSVSNIKIGKLEAAVAVISANHTSKVGVQYGNVANMKIEASDVSNVQTGDVEVQSVQISARSISKVSVKVLKQAQVTAEDMS